MQKALIFRVLVGIKKTETPIFQGISVVLPKLYLGGGDGGNRTRVRKLILTTFYECSRVFEIPFETRQSADLFRR